MFTKKKEKGCQSQSPSITTLLRFYFVKPICKKMQSNPGLINHLGLPMQIHFLKINPNVLQWLEALQSSNSFTCAWENLSEKVFGWRLFDMENMAGQTFFWKKTHVFFKSFWIKFSIFLNKYDCFLTKNKDLSKTKIVLWINPRFQGNEV